jgi:hypothetical protein
MCCDLKGVQKRAPKGDAKSPPRSTGIEKPETKSGEVKITAAAKRIEA